MNNQQHASSRVWQGAWWRFSANHPVRAWCVRLLALVLVILGALYPDPRIAVRNLQHWSNPSQLIEPDNPGLTDWLSQLKNEDLARKTPQETFKIVQAQVYKRLPYAYDWETWGAVDYIPSVTEALQAGREDCDGRAVVAASLLCGLGYDAKLVVDGQHVWVWTPQGETMSPGPIPTVVVTDEGVRTNWSGLLNTPRILAFGIHVFPWLREAIVLMAAVLVCVRPRQGRLRPVIALVMLLVGLTLLKLPAWHQPAAYWGAYACALAGGLLALGPFRNRIAGKRARSSQSAAVEDAASKDSEHEPVSERPNHPPPTDSAASDPRP